MNLPEARGFLTVQDIETGTIKSLDISTTLKKTKPYLALLRKLNIDHLALSNGEDEEIWIKKSRNFLIDASGGGEKETMRYIFISLFMSAVFLGIGSIHVNAQEQPQTQGQAEEAQAFVLTEKPLEIWTFIDDYRVITGKTLHLTVQALWRLGITVNLEGVDKIDLSPCKIEGVTIGERQIFDNEHDYIVITYTLSLPSSVGEGIYSIPSFTLSYRNEVDKTEGKAASSPVAIKKVPILVEGKVDKDVITIGDRINYALTIRHEKNVRVIWENIEKLNFSPLDILKKDIEKRTEGNTEKILINYTLSLYELGEKEDA